MAALGTPRTRICVTLIGYTGTLKTLLEPSRYLRLMWLSAGALREESLRFREKLVNCLVEDEMDRIVICCDDIFQLHDSGYTAPVDYQSPVPLAERKSMTRERIET
eukprot:GHVU01163492.1.p1 GENE.GHVU01163492.1~~GHVU01163492.1.p1  ORF type:complete len:106 (-),score=6.74 GHVU01163492.1:305-622(-)